MGTFRCWFPAFGLALASLLLPLGAPGQVDIGFERDRMKNILKNVTREIEKNFYDPALKELNWQGLQEEARARIDRAAAPSDMLTAIFALVDKLQDSHTLFIPPAHVNKVEFGFEAKAYGAEVRIFELKKGGAAARAGLLRGDRILAINGYPATRDSIDLMMLYFHRLRPTGSLQIAYRRGNEAAKEIVVPAKITPGRRQEDLSNLDTIWKYIREAESEAPKFLFANHPGDIGYVMLPEFSGDSIFLGGLMGKIKKSRAVIVDVRGNPGGSVKTLEDFAGFFEERPTVMADLVGRKRTEPLKARPSKPRISGPLFILVDSQSGSAAEIFARHFQRTGRAVVIGDHTAGRVNVSRVFPLQVGVEVVAFFAVQVATARVVFPDGGELEKRGVVPDEVCLPEAGDLAEGRDPCLRRAIAMARKALGLPEEMPEENTPKRN